MNKERRKKKRINEGIGWKEHFMRSLGEVKDKVVREKGSEIKGRDEEDEINGEEIKRAIGKLKDGKATGMDGGVKVWGKGDKEISQTFLQ